MNLQDQLIWDIIRSIPDDWSISDKEKREFYKNMVEAKQVLPKVVNMISQYVD